MPDARVKETRELLVRLGIRSELDILKRAEAEKKNSIAVALVWRTHEQSPTGFSGYELVRHDVLTGDPVADRRFGGNKFYHRPELAEARAYVKNKYGIPEMVPTPGFLRSLIPVDVRKQVLAWLRQARKLYG